MILCSFPPPTCPVKYLQRISTNESKLAFLASFFPFGGVIGVTEIVKVVIGGKSETNKNRNSTHKLPFPIQIPKKRQLIVRH